MNIFNPAPWKIIFLFALNFGIFTVFELIGRRCNLPIKSNEIENIDRNVKFNHQGYPGINNLFGNIHIDEYIVDIDHYYWLTYERQSIFCDNTPNVKILFLTTKHYHDTYMDRHFFWDHAAAKRHPCVIDAVLWGPGFYGYDESISLKNNIQKIYGNFNYFEIIHPWIWTPHIEIEIHQLSKLGITIIQRESECWNLDGGGCMSSAIRWNSSIVSMDYAYEIFNYMNYTYRRVLVHSPNVADPYIFLGEIDDINRDIDILIVGYVHDNVYPTRSRFLKLVDSNRLNAVVLPHPDYYNRWPIEKLKKFNITHTSCEKQVLLYSSYLKRAKIVLTGSSRYKYGLQKYSEIPLAGALMIGDVPNERQLDFRSFMVELTPNDSDEYILKTIKWWLHHPVERLERTRMGQQLTLQKYTIDNQIDIWLHAYQAFKNEKYGIYYPYTFSVSCSAINTRNWSVTCVKTLGLPKNF